METYKLDPNILDKYGSIVAMELFSFSQGKEFSTVHGLLWDTEEGTYIGGPSLAMLLCSKDLRNKFPEGVLYRPVAIEDLGSDLARAPMKFILHRSGAFLIPPKGEIVKVEHLIVKGVTTADYFEGLRSMREAAKKYAKIETQALRSMPVEEVNHLYRTITQSLDTVIDLVTGLRTA